MRFWPPRLAPSSEEITEIPFGGRNQELLVVCHAEDAEGLAVMQNICSMMAFAKLHFTVLDLARRASWPILDGFDSIVVCTERLAAIDEESARRLEDHVHRGGGLLVAYRCWNESLRSLLGFGENDPAPAIHDSNGLAFEREACPGATGLRVEASYWMLEHSRFDVDANELDARCAVLASDSTGRPLLWRRLFGTGRVVYWNTGVLFCRALRGFVLQTLLDSLGTGVAAIAGFAMFHVDDFPTSLSDARLEPVVSEFPGMDWNAFMFDVWHRDMMALKRKHGLKYSWYTVMNYQDIETGPQPDPAALAVTSGADVLSRRLERAVAKEEDDEYGFHGYNHEPLTATYWSDPQTLRTKLELARDLWDEIMPDRRPASWVPANNWYDAGCLQVLGEVFPEISTVCSIHSNGDFALGEYREFGPEPWRETMLCLPRETYGYVMAPELKMMMLSQVAGMGAWTHFVHPDDIFDIPTGETDDAYRRNPRKRMWRATNETGDAGLLPELDDWLGQLRDLFPWLEFVTTSQAEERYRRHVGTMADVVTGDDAIEITTDTESLFYVRTRPRTVIVPVTGGELIDSRTVEGGVLNVVRCRPGRSLFRLAD